VFTHELRSPVSVIRSLLQTVLSGYAAEINPQQRDILERAVRRVDFLRKLIDDLLDLANGRARSKRRPQSPVRLEAWSRPWSSASRCRHTRMFDHGVHGEPLGGESLFGPRGRLIAFSTT